MRGKIPGFWRAKGGRTPQAFVLSDGCIVDENQNSLGWIDANMAKALHLDQSVIAELAEYEDMPELEDTTRDIPVVEVITTADVVNVADAPTRGEESRARAGGGVEVSGMGRRARWRVGDARGPDKARGQGGVPDGG